MELTGLEDFEEGPPAERDSDDDEPGLDGGSSESL
jgi:hypothetical protein